MLCSDVHLNSFWRGYSSVLSLVARRRVRRPLTYRGVDIARLSPEHALEMDREIIEKCISAAFAESIDEHRTEPELTLQGR